MHYLLKWLPEKERIPLSENTFILTLDGDVHFEPESIHFLVDDLRSNKEVAAVCGRTHPVGSGKLFIQYIVFISNEFLKLLLLMGSLIKHRCRNLI